MPRYRRAPLTLAELYQPGPPVRVRDLMAVTGWSRSTVLASVDAGDLVPIRRTAGMMARYYFERVRVRQWLEQAGFMAPHAFHEEHISRNERN